MPRGITGRQVRREGPYKECERWVARLVGRWIEEGERLGLYVIDFELTRRAYDLSVLVREPAVAVAAVVAPIPVGPTRRHVGTVVSVHVLTDQACLIIVPCKPDRHAALFEAPLAESIDATVGASV